jgi:hypothetical protein
MTYVAPVKDMLFVLEELVNIANTSTLPSSYPATQTCYLKWLESKRTGLIAKVLSELDFP